jgi:hypothetical protein
MQCARVFNLTVLTAITCLALIGCHRNEAAELDALQRAMEIEQVNLSRFDDLDFNVFSEQRWELLGRTHSKNVVVHWPDGRTSHGLEQHSEDLKAIFVWAPDARITDHPVKLANGSWTAVTGILEGTFTEPMPTSDGRNIAPTGKPFRLPMATFGRWKNGVMEEVFVFWDNQALFAQLGVAEPPQGTYEDPFSLN